MTDAGSVAVKLARTLVLLLLAISLALFSVVGAYEVLRGVRDFDDNAAADLAITGRALRPALAEVSRVEGEARAQELLEHADADTPNVQIRWVSFRAGADAVDAATRARLERGEDVALGRGGGRGDHLVVYVPLPSGAAIELSQPLVAVRVLAVRIFEERLLSSLGAIAIASLLSIVAGVWIVGRPMQALAAQARRIGEGDLARRVRVVRGDEIGELADEMNHMCDRLLDANARAAAEAEARERAMQQLRRADRLSTVGTLASGMAHELGTPLSIIAGRAKMIASGGEPDAEPPADDVKYARIIIGQTEKMARIMRGLLDFARRKPAQKRATDVREVARRTLELLGPLAKKRGVTLQLDDDDGPAIADVDVAQLEQALANLVVNGVHATREGGEVVVSTAEVTARPHARPHAPEACYLCIRVRDDGDGIRPEDLPHVFEPFFTTKDVGEGTGLGLSVTYGIVEDHGGFIDVTSELGHGACFSIYLPHGERDRVDGREASAPRQESAP